MLVILTNYTQTLTEPKHKPNLRLTERRSFRMMPLPL